MATLKSRKQKIFTLCCFKIFFPNTHKKAQRHGLSGTLLCPPIWKHIKPPYSYNLNVKWYTFNQKLLTMMTILLGAWVEFVFTSNWVLKLQWQSHCLPHSESLELQISLEVRSFLLRKSFWPVLSPVIFPSWTFQ